MSDIVNHTFYLIFLLILTFLIVNNADALVSIFAQSGQTISEVSYVLQGRSGTKQPTAKA